MQYVIVAVGSPDDGHVISQSIPPTDSGRCRVRRSGSESARQRRRRRPRLRHNDDSADDDHHTTDGQLGDHQDRQQSSGSTVTYTIIVRNDGPFDVTGARVTDNMPSELTLVTWTCSDDPGAIVRQRINNIDVSVSLAVGTTVAFTVTATVTHRGRENTATIAVPSGVTDPSPGNNSATDTRTGFRSQCVPSGGFEEVAQ